MFFGGLISADEGSLVGESQNNLLRMLTCPRPFFLGVELCLHMVAISFVLTDSQNDGAQWGSVVNTKPEMITHLLVQISTRKKVLNVSNI